MKALVVDGYNAIYKIPHLRKLLDESLQAARGAVTKLAKEYQRKRGGIDKVCVVFDGKDAYRDEMFGIQPNHVFSKTGQGDLELIKVVRRLSKKYHVEVVSDDNFVRNNSRSYNATIVGVSKFAQTSGERRKYQSKTKNDIAADKVSPEAASLINEELKKHWGIS